jgi:hypothetical protein
MAKYARGKKSYAISDRSGLRVRYTELKTTWDGLRVSPEDWEPKQPQLTPAKNVVDATALFNGRPDTDPENVAVYIGFTQDWTIDPRLRPPVGVPAFAHVGLVSINMESVPSPSGLGGTGAIGAELLELSIDEAGVAGTGAVGVEIPAAFVTGVSGGGGAGAVGVEALSISIDEAGVGGTGAVGAETIELQGWGQSTWGSGTWGDG